jgi:hypothetical protein
MFVNRRWRRRLQRHVGPEHGRRRAFGSPDREHRRDMRSPTRAGTRRDAIRRRAIRHAIRRRTIPHATDPTAHDPATDDTARDDHSRRRVRRPAIRHATSPTARDPATGYPAATGHTGRHDWRQVISHTLIISYLKYARNMPGICPEYTRICLMMPDDVSLPGLSGDRVTG